MNSQISTYHLFYRPNNKRAVFWAKKIDLFIKKSFPGIKRDSKKPEIVIALGGDGTILESARKYHELDSIILGLNLGKVGFLASVRNEKDFTKTLINVFRGKYRIIERMMLSANVERKGKNIFNAEALNELVVKNPLGMVDLEAEVDGHIVKYIRGTGILVATATGSTAYNLSAHGPIVVPDIKCFVITELLAHNIPSPSMIINHQNVIKIKVSSYRPSGVISLSKSSQKFDVLVSADGNSVFPLQEKDLVIIKSSPHSVKFVEVEKNYFFKSLKEKFRFN